MTSNGIGEESLFHPYGNPYSLWKDDIFWRKTKYGYVAITQGHGGDLWILMKMGRNIKIYFVLYIVWWIMNNTRKKYKIHYNIIFNLNYLNIIIIFIIE